MNTTTSEFYHDFRQEMLAGAEARSDFQLAEFMNVMAEELIDTGFIEGFEFCHYRAPKGMRIDGFWFNDDGGLELFIADFDCRDALESLTKTEVNATFKRLTNFFEASYSKSLFQELEETSPEYGLARRVADHGSSIHRLNFILFSERALSDRLQQLKYEDVSGIPSSFHIWDITRLQRQRASRGHKEPLDIDFVESFGHGIPCLPAHLDSHSYQSYLIIMPATVLASLYGRYGARLLEQNVRCFLQARNKVNKGIRNTILNEPEMFFAYNNGITATARDIETEVATCGTRLTRTIDLQIVNGGQTVASLFHTAKKDKASLDDIFVQMKLSVIDIEESEKVVPKISEYANTQNRINAADFFSNHPFHVRMEEFSRRLWAPAVKGTQRETKWFYERARGQYADAQADMTPTQRKKFRAENPKPQMFTKTDLAKFENVWDDHPRWVNLGAQKNFARYAERIGKEWSKSQVSFNEWYFRHMIARAIIFRNTERLVSSADWYDGGYRANIVAYTIAVIGECCRRRKLDINYERIWKSQEIYPNLLKALKSAAAFVNSFILNPPAGFSNISEWCKRENCWQIMLSNMDRFQNGLQDGFWSDLVSIEEKKSEEKAAKYTQRIEDGINAQKRIFEIPADDWSTILSKGRELKIFSPKEIDILTIAKNMPKRIPTEKQCFVLLDLLDKVREEGIFQG